MSKHSEEKLMAASKVMTDYTEQVSTENEQEKSYKGYLQLDNKKAKELAEVEQTPAVSEKFENLPDEEIEKLYEQALANFPSYLEQLNHHMAYGAPFGDDFNANFDRG